LKVRIPFLSGILCALLSSATLPVQAREASYSDVFKLNPNASYIMVFAFPSAAWLDWSNPSRLARTTLQSQIAKKIYGYPSSIGHAQIAWSCQQADGSQQEGAAGQTGQDNGQGVSTLLQGWGMSLLELVYDDGHLESAQEVEERIQSGAKAQQFSWIGFQVKPEQCQKLANFVKAYDQSGAAINYGFPVEPLKMEGAGCTSFANAAVETAGIPFPLRKFWTRHYDVPLIKMGRQTKLPAHTKLVPNARLPQENRSVPLTEFLWGNVTWAQAGESSIPFTYYDPELFYENFLHLENVYRKSLGLQPKPPIRTEGYDEFQLPLKNASEAWIEGLLKKGTAMKLGFIHQTSGLIVDLSHEP